MKAILPTNGAQIKKNMKCNGIKVLRCRDNKNGILMTIEGSIENQKKALAFFAEYDLKITQGLTPRLGNKDQEYIDYGTLFRIVEVGSKQWNESSKNALGYF
jgi:hypothetical protein